MMNQIFVSYSRKDKDIADKIIGELISIGIPVWQDTRNLRAGEQWVNGIETALRSCSGAICLESPFSMTSKFVEKEIVFLQSHNKFVLPVWIQRNKDVRLLFSNIQYIELLQTFCLDKYKEQLNKIASALHFMQLQNFVRLNTKPSDLKFLAPSIANKGLPISEQLEDFLAQSDLDELERTKKHLEGRYGPSIYDKDVLEILSLEDEIENIPFINFVNRTTEIREFIHDDPNNVYSILEAPTGYGKTALLKEVKRKFLENDYYCVYVTLRNKISTEAVLKDIQQELEMQGVKNISFDDEHLDSKKAYILGHEVRIQRNSKKGLVLLFDEDQYRNNRYSSVLFGIVNSILPEIFNGLTAYSEDDLDKHFLIKTQSFRVVLAGQHLASRILIHDDKYDTVLLKPFTFKVVRSLCEDRVKNKNNIDDIATYLYFVTSGHPRCLARIIKKMDGELNINFLDDFIDQREDEIEHIVVQEVNSVRSSLELELRGTLDKLSLYRIIDRKLLRHLLENNELPEFDSKSVAFVYRELVTSGLLEIYNSRGGFLSHDMTRKMLVLHKRSDLTPRKFKMECPKAQNVYYGLMEQYPDNNSSHLWAIEILYLFLLSEVSIFWLSSNKKNQNSAREKRRQLLDAEVSLITGALEKFARDEIEINVFEMVEAMRKDLELKFLFNNYLQINQSENNEFAEYLSNFEKMFSFSQPGENNE